MRILCSAGAGSFAFERPERTLRAESLDEVVATLRDADDARAHGKYVAGFVAYEAGAAFVPRQQNPPSGALPLVELGVYAAPSAALDRTARAARQLFACGPLVPLVTKAHYEANVAAILARIREGDVYQVNLAVPFGFTFAGDARALHDELTDGDPFPFSALVESDRYAIVSCSPELFVRFSTAESHGVAQIETRPMKGTATLSDSGALANAKNRAEHVMIVDLLRNDLHRLSDDVTVERLFEIERYPGYATSTSTIVARRSDDFTLVQTFGAMFPCGSITGAPKVTAMHAIAALETSRGAFCGSIGYVAPDGTGTWNVAIRTATLDSATGRGTIHVGGGIVADSNARDEWAEILVKRRFFDRVTPAFALIETMRRDPDGSYTRLDAHLARLAESANAMHFACDLPEVRARLLALDRPATTALVRVELDADGATRIDARDFKQPADVAIVWSPETVDTNDPLQRYKTTWRPHYRAAEQEAHGRGAFDALLCNRAGFVADGARTNVFIARDGDATLSTPPLSDGALPGILRAELLAAGRAREMRLTRADVERAPAVYVGNSARGLLYVVSGVSENSGSRKNGIAIG